MSNDVKWLFTVKPERNVFMQRQKTASVGDCSTLLTLPASTCLQGSSWVFEVPFMENLLEFLQQAWYENIKNLAYTIVNFSSILIFFIGGVF